MTETEASAPRGRERSAGGSPPGARRRAGAKAAARIRTPPSRPSRSVRSRQRHQAVRTRLPGRSSGTAAARSRIAGEPARCTRERNAGSNPTPSAKTPSRDILFRRSADGRNGAEFVHSRRYVRTTRAGRQPLFGPVGASLRPLSLTQPNHGHFGTDVESSIIQWVGGQQKGSGFGKAPLRRSEPGSNRSVRYVYFKPQTGLTMGTHR